MAEEFQYTGGAGCGPAGSSPAGSAFEDESVGPAREDIRSLPLYYENESLILTTDA